MSGSAGAAGEVRRLATNVLFHYLLADDPEQSPIARSLVYEAEESQMR